MPRELRGWSVLLGIGSRVEMDMEDSSYTERSLKIVHEMHKKHPGGVRAVFRRICIAARRTFTVCATPEFRFVYAKARTTNRSRSHFRRKPMSTPTTSS